MKNPNIAIKTNPINHDHMGTHALEGNRTRCGMAVETQTIQGANAWTLRKVMRASRELYVNCTACKGE